MRAVNEYNNAIGLSYRCVLKEWRYWWLDTGWTWTHMHQLNCMHAHLHIQHIVHTKWNEEKTAELTRKKCKNAPNKDVNKQTTAMRWNVEIIEMRYKMSSSFYDFPNRFVMHCSIQKYRYMWQKFCKWLKTCPSILVWPQKPEQMVTGIMSVCSTTKETKRNPTDRPTNQQQQQQANIQKKWKRKN